MLVVVGLDHVFQVVLSGLIREGSTHTRNLRRLCAGPRLRASRTENLGRAADSCQVGRQLGTELLSKFLLVALTISMAMTMPVITQEPGRRPEGTEHGVRLDRSR